MATMAQHRRQEAVLMSRPFPLGRLRTLPSSSSSAEVRRQATMQRLVAIIEAFVADGLVSRSESHAPPPRSPILDDIYTRAEDAAIGSWPKLQEHYRRWFGIRLNQTACPTWRQIEAMINARNCIAHGVGALTRRMARKDTAQLRRDFSTIGVIMIGNTVQIPESAVRNSSLTGRAFILWLDQALSTYDAGLAATSA